MKPFTVQNVEKWKKTMDSKKTRQRRLSVSWRVEERGAVFFYWYPWMILVHLVVLLQLQYGFKIVLFPSYKFVRLASFLWLLHSVTRASCVVQTTHSMRSTGQGSGPMDFSNVFDNWNFSVEEIDGATRARIKRIGHHFFRFLLAFLHFQIDKSNLMDKFVN